MHITMYRGDIKFVDCQKSALNENFVDKISRIPVVSIIANSWSKHF